MVEDFVEIFFQTLLAPPAVCIGHTLIHCGTLEHFICIVWLSLFRSGNASVQHYLCFITHRKFLFILARAIFIEFENNSEECTSVEAMCAILVLGVVNLVPFSSPCNINSGAVLSSVRYFDVKRT